MLHPLPPHAHPALTTQPTAPHLLSMIPQEANLYVTSNTTMVFLSGNHALDRNITAANVARLTMHGESFSGNMATVVRNEAVGISFTDIVYTPQYSFFSFYLLRWILELW